MIEPVDVWFALLRMAIMIVSGYGAYHMYAKGHNIRAFVLVWLFILETIFLVGVNQYIPMDFSRTVFLMVLLFSSYFLGFSERYLSFEKLIEQKIKKLQECMAK